MVIPKTNGTKQSWETDPSIYRNDSNQWTRVIQEKGAKQLESPFKI